MAYGSVVTVLALVGLTKKRFGHYTILTILSLKSLSMKCTWNLNFHLSRIIVWHKSNILEIT